VYFLIRKKRKKEIVFGGEHACVEQLTGLEEDNDMTGGSSRAQ
jgi:hypothetical protein